MCAMTDYIHLISEKSDDGGDLLLKLMDELGTNNLSVVTQEQAKNFYDKHRIADLPVRKSRRFPCLTGRYA